MADTTLKAYIAELKLLLEQEALEEVMGHCRHILQHFPKNVETYRFLARALLEKNRHQEAGDVFQRVLSALPDDFVAHLGLSAVAEEAGQLPLAIWHLERAYEQEPNNGALRDEIKRLYEKRDGVAPERLQVTLGGLAHSYVRGRLYEQAVSELNKALTQMPDRVDLQLLLTQVLWESDRPVEAAEAALKALDQLPDSIEANRIMAMLWLNASRPSDAAPFVSRLDQLDPFLAWKVVNPEKELPRDAFSLPHLDWDARAAAALATDVPDWVSSISNVFEAPESVSLSSDSRAAESPASGSTRKPQSGLLRARGNTDLFSNPDVSSKESKSSEESVEIPDWFKDTSATQSNTVAETPTDDVPDWFKDASPEPTEPSAAVPSWLDDMPDVNDITGSQLPSGFTDLLAGSASRPPAQAAPSSAAMPSWLDEDEEVSPPAPSGALDAMSWLNTGPLPSLDDVAPTSEPTNTGDEALDWMMDMPAETAGNPEPAPSGALDAMSWLNTGPLPSLDDVGATNETTSSDSDQAADESAPSGALDAMSWLNTGPLPQLDEVAPTSEPGSTELPQDLSALDWMAETPDINESSPEAAEPAAGGLDALSWLNADSVDEVTSLSEPASVETTPESASFDWMADMPTINESGAEAAEPAAGGLDALSWLSTDSVDESSQTSAAPSQEQSGFGWMGNVTAETENFGAQQEQPSFEWMTDSAESLTPEPEAESEQPDPLAWFQGYTNSAESVSSNAEQETEAPLAEATDAPDWLSRLAPSNVEQPSIAPSSEPSLELEEDWLTSFETGPLVAPESWSDQAAAPAAQFNDANTPAEPPAANDWLSSFGSSGEDSESAASGDDWLGSMKSSGDVPAETSDAASDDWLSSLGSASADVNTAAPSSNDDWLPPAATDNFESLLQGATEQANQPLTAGDDGQSTASNMSDWMNSFSDNENAEPETESSTAGMLDNVDFSELGSSLEGAEPAEGTPDWLSAMGMELDTESPPAEPAGETPDWLSAMGAPSEQATMPAASLDDLDFGDLDSTPAEPAGEAPDWLSAFADETTASVPTDQPNARHAMPEHFPEVDLSKLPEEAPTTADNSTEYDFSFNGVAQPANLMNTNGETNGSSFSFKRKPAWMRKGKPGKR